MSSPLHRDNDGVDVIFQADAIRPPLTGIGRYSTELAKGLLLRSDVARVRFFSVASWISDPLNGLNDDAKLCNASAETGSEEGLKARMRRRLAANKSAVQIYQTLVPALAGWRLRKECQSIYHSPNYALPNFGGAAIATVHDLSHELYPEFHPAARVEYMRRAMPATLRRANHLITDAESVREEIISHYGWPANRISSVPLGVDSSFCPRSDAELATPLSLHGLRPGGYSLYVGTIEPRKNVDGLLTAYSMLPNKLRMRFPLVLAGSGGWNSEATHARIKIAVNQGWARYLSFVPQQQLPLLFAGARIFVFPSHYEGFGLPVLEAMASGSPVITSNASSLPEVVGDAACLIHPQDTDGFARQIVRLLEDDSEWKRIRSAALKRAADFTWQKCVDKTVEVYRRVANSSA